MSHARRFFPAPSRLLRSRARLFFSWHPHPQAQAWDSVTSMFEERIKALTPGVKTINYDVHDLFRWLDNLADMSCLVCVAHGARGRHASQHRR